MAILFLFSGVDVHQILRQLLEYFVDVLTRFGTHVV
jgi:hypothetical protein